METIVTIPDEDFRSWYVVFLAFCQNLLKESVPYTFLINVAVAQKDTSSSLLMFIVGGLHFGACQFLSPIACALANWYSFRMISTAGPCILLFSMIVSHLAFIYDCLYILLLTFGLLGGFGCSMIHMSSKLMPSFWFCNRRGFAHNLACSGHALGILTIPNLSQLLITHSIQNRFRTLFYLFAGLYVPLICLGWLTPKMCAIIVNFQRRISVQSGSVRFKDEVEAAEIARSYESLATEFRTFRIFGTGSNTMFPRVKDIVGSNNITMLVPKLSMQKVFEPPWRHGIRFEDAYETNISSASMTIGPQRVRFVQSKENFYFGVRPMYRVDIFYTWNLFNVSLYKRQDTILDFHLAATRAMSRNDLLQEMDKNMGCFICPEAVLRTLLTMLNCNLLTDIYFVVLLFNGFMISAGMIIPLIFIVSRGDEIGMEDDSFYIVTYVGLGQVFGRLLATILALFTTGVSYYYFNVEILMVAGGFTLLLTIVNNDYTIMFLATALGALYALNQTIRLTAIFSIIKLTNLTNAMGHILIWNGFGCLASTTAAGYLYIKFGSVSYVYWFAGGTLISAGLIQLLVKCIKNYTLRSVAVDL